MKFVHECLNPVCSNGANPTVGLCEECLDSAAKVSKEVNAKDDFFSYQAVVTTMAFVTILMALGASIINR